MNNPIFIGLDIGTSSCKALAIDLDAKFLASETAEYPCYSPQPGWSEQLPADWWQGAQTALQKLTAQLPAVCIAGIGLSGQMHGMVALDAQNNVLRPAVLWNDQRTATQCAEITAAAGGPEGLLAFTNNAMLTGFTGGKVLWMRENEPALYARCAKVINPKDFINFLLTGVLATEVSDASGTGFFDVKTGVWSAKLLALLGIAPELFAAVHESTEIIGYVTAEAAARTGLPAGLPVAAGGGDAVLSALGMGLSGAAQVAVTLGTSGVVARHVPDFFENSGAKLQFNRACLPGLYHAMGVTLAAAGSYQWYESAFGDLRLGTKSARFQALDAQAAASPAGANGVLFLPYLSGERCPVNDPDARGAFVGLSAQSTRGDMNRAVLEGVAFSLRQVYGVMAAATGAAQQITLAGGGAASPLWRQIVADVFNLPVVTLEAGEAGSGFGGAMLAGLGLGAWESPQAVAARLAVKTKTLPNPENAAVYEARFAAYERLYPALKQA